MVQLKKHYLCIVNHIEIKHLTIGYRHHKVAKDLSARLESGYLTCLIGCNGLGKSTLLRTIAGFQPALEGEVNIGVDDRSYCVDNLSRAHLSHADRFMVSEALRITGISSLADRDISTLSDGERQKVMIAKAQAQQTPIVLLDEPTAFLDYPSKVYMMKLLAKMAHEEGKIILLSTHDLDIVLRHADHILTLDNGLKTISKEELSAELGNLK